jgi:hypothetical protein
MYNNFGQGGLLPDGNAHPATPKYTAEVPLRCSVNLLLKRITEMCMKIINIDVTLHFLKVIFFFLWRSECAGFLLLL